MHTFILLIALSSDVFLASAACGTQQIQIKRKAALCISMVCSGVLFLSLRAGEMLEGIMRHEDIGWLGTAVFFAIGAEKLAEYFVKSRFKKCNANDTAAIVSPGTMSVPQSIMFALAMSVDGLFAGVGAGESGYGIAYAIILNTALTFAAVNMGCAAGRKISGLLERDFSWVAGAMFIVLAIGKSIGKNPLLSSIQIW
jgi:putative Mn2+ efflux pump MntP